MSKMIHESAICESIHIGNGTRIWAFAHVLPQAVIGEDCNICDHVFVENDVVIGDRVTVKSGVQLWDGVRLANDVFVGPNATFTNDKNPRSKQKPPFFLVTNVEEGASIGANATILPGITIGRSALIGAGSVVTSDVPPYAIVIGNPARIIKKRFNKQVIKKLLQYSWWELDDDKINLLAPYLLSENFDLFFKKLKLLKK